MNRLFVYGIFLDEVNRMHYGMTEPRYATVKGYATVGNYIVEAIPVEGATLTGLIVEMNPQMWPQLDRLERGYDRVTIITTDGEKAYMYAAKERA